MPLAALSRCLFPVDDVERAVPLDHRRAAVAIVLRTDAEGPAVLMMVRVEDERDPWSGQVSLPGGHAEEGDTGLDATAARETREEVGVDLAPALQAGAFGPVQARVRGRMLATTIVPVVWVHPAPPGFALGPEAQAAFWLPLDRAASGELDGVHVYERDGRRKEMPCWHFEGRAVWGLTRLILDELLARAGHVLL